MCPSIQIYKKEPLKIHIEKGKKYSFCPCGLSSTFPYCDGTHKQKAVGTRSHKYEATDDGYIWICFEDDEQT